MMVIVTSDHGEAFGEKGFIEHGTSTYQDQVNIPLVIKYPQQTEAKTDSRVVSLADLMPTILDAVNIAVPEGLDGKSLLSQDPSGHRYAVAKSFPQADWNRREREIERAVVTEEWKYITTPPRKVELYQTSDDPGEETDLAAAGENEQLPKMQLLLEEWLSTVPAYAGKKRKLSREELDRLRSLGYVH